jgi:FG-GAP-like repeat
MLHTRARSLFSLGFPLALLAACSEAPMPMPDRVAPGGDAGDAGSSAMDASSDGASSDAASAMDADASSCRAVMCGAVCCRSGELCRYDQCVPDLGRCSARSGDAGAGDASADGGSGSNCPSDSYCDAMGYCTPYGVPTDRTLDSTCTTRAIPAPLVPATQCLWAMGPINGTPAVANLNVPLPDGERSPSIIVAVRDRAGSVYSSGGTLHIFNSRTCAVDWRLSEADQTVAAAGTVAVGDLNGDGVSEIVAGSGSGGVIAFRYDSGTRQWVTAWRAAGNAYTATAPILADVTGDARPEVISGMHVWDSMGNALVASPPVVEYQGYQQPTFVVDTDSDGDPELVANGVLWRLDSVGRRWVQLSTDRGTPTAGFEAIADFGEFPGRAGDAMGRPEIVHFNTARLQVRTVGGEAVFTAPAAPVGGGGPPAVADLDGDGRPEIVVAGRALVAYDPDCAMGGSPRGGRCASGRTDGILWVQSGLRDASSAINGVTVFDFDGDGRTEVVEADECFTRIFDGTTGRPRWSAPRVSCTFIEMPVVADVDGDLSAEIVVGANNLCGSECGLAAGAPDPILPGFACVSDDACPMGSRCAGGLCRCTANDQCGAGNTCTAPLMADGMGNVCRSTYNPSVGLKVYGDARNRWVPSRPVWNQFAYSITNIGDDGRVPDRTTMRSNWRTPGLNNFRQNTQGNLGDQTAPNLTIAPAPGGCLAMGAMGVQLSARFCNRGTGVAGANSSISFFSVARDGTRMPLCTASAMAPVAPGTCVDLRCAMPVTLPAESSVEAEADANDQVQECDERDNLRTIYRPEDCIG